MVAMNVAFCVRSDFNSKFGGDTHQVNEYIKNFSMKINSEVLSLNEVMRKGRVFDVYIIVNIDRHYEAVEFYKYLNKINVMKKVMVLPIHHCYKSIELYNKKRFGSLWKVIKLFGGVYLVEKARSFILSAKNGDEMFFTSMRHFFQNNRKKIHELLNKANYIVFIANGERKDVFRDFSCGSLLNYSIVRNGVSDQFINDVLRNESEPDIKDIDVLVCGRIERRKNQLRVAQILKDSKYKVVFIGALNKNFSSYGVEFKKTVDDSVNMSHIDAVPVNCMSTMYFRSRLHLSASYFEVSSLVDIEAYAAGCNVISSVRGNSHELLGVEGTRYVDPMKLDDLVFLIDGVINEEVNRKDRINFCLENSWKLSANEFEKLLLKLN